MHVRHQATWRAPPVGSVKIHVDAAVGRHGDRGAFAAICRDDSRNFLEASAVSVADLCLQEILEAMATNEALALARDLACTNIVVASDCLNTVNHLKSDYLGASKAIIYELRRSMQDFASAEILHQLRVSNLEAHLLAKAVISLPFGGHVWLAVKPDFIFFVDA
ncbi:hypothetical protein D1007_50245 [Hordeum vulgare]|nr:hypothetical protein D1007_50245 [Hordeum vulgare]